MQQPSSIAAPPWQRYLTVVGLLVALTAPAWAKARHVAPKSLHTTPAVSGTVPALSAVTVKGVRYGVDAVALPSTIMLLGRRALTQGKPQVNLSESLRQIPGLVVQNRYNYAQDLQISIRGFGAEAPFGVQGVYMTLDGIPLTMPDGRGQSQVINLPTIGLIKVIEGPFAALYGNAAGGVIQAYTRVAPTPPEVSLRTWRGSYGKLQTTLVGGGHRGAWSGLAGITHFHTEGWRQHSAATRKQFNGVLSWDPSSENSYKLVLNALNQDALDPSGLTRAELQHNPRQVDPVILKFNTRKTVRNRQAGLVWNHRFDAGNSLRMSSYTGTRHIVQYLPFTGHFGFSAGGVIDLLDHFNGITTEFTHRGLVAAHSYTLATGLDYARENEHRKGFVNEFGLRGTLRNDQFNTVDNFAQYMEGHLDLTPRLSVSGGIRHDQVNFNSTNAADALFGAGTGGRARYASTDPVLGLLYRVGGQTRIYADYGHGFVTPTFYQLAYRPNGQPGLNFALQPMHLRNAEVGLRSHFGILHINASVFYIDTDNQIVVYASHGGRTTYTNAGRTRRYGTDMSMEVALPGHFSAHLAYSYIHVHFVGAPYNGNVMPGVPRQQFYAGLSWRPRLQHAVLHGFYSTLSTLVRSKVFVDSQNSSAAQGYGVLNWVAGIRQRHGLWQVAEFLRVDNLLNQNYIGAVIIAAHRGRYFEAAPGRNAMVGVQITRAFSP